MTEELGTLVETPQGWELRYVRDLDHPPAAVWRAFTEPDLVGEWFPTTLDGELREGGALRFAFKGDVAGPMAGEVLEAAPPHRLAFTWGPDTLRFELLDHDGGTRLTMTVLLEEHGKAARDGAGWHECLSRLASALAGGPEPSVQDTWGHVHPAYVDRFGPEAATIGPPPEASRSGG
jgi:uncharacterized protein YndB with AHSA1/START domain